MTRETDVKPAGGWGLSLVGVLCVLAPAYVIDQTPSRPGEAWLLALTVTVLAGLRYATLIARGERRLYELMFWLFVYSFFGLAPLVQYRTDAVPFTTPWVDRSLNGPTMWAILAGTLAFAVGAALRRAPSTPTRTEFVSRRRVGYLGLAALLAAAYFVSEVGVGPLLASRAELTRASLAAWGDPTTAALTSGAVFMSLLVAAVAGVLRIRDRQRGMPWDMGHALTFVVIAVLLLVINPLSSPRYIVGVAYGGLAAALGAFDTSRRFRLMASAAVAGILLVYPLADAFRYTSHSQVDTSGIVDSLASPDFDAARQVTNALDYVEQLGVTDGWQALGVALFWVPRSLWPEKPRDTSVVLAEFMGYGETNLSAPLWAELFVNGGWPLLLVGMGLVGWWLRGRDMAGMRRAAANPAALILPFYLVFLLRGSLLQAMANLVVIVLASRFVVGSGSGRVDNQNRADQRGQQRREGDVAAA